LEVPVSNFNQVIGYTVCDCPRVPSMSPGSQWDRILTRVNTASPTVNFKPSFMVS